MGLKSVALSLLVNKGLKRGSGVEAWLLLVALLRWLVSARRTRALHKGRTDDRIAGGSKLVWQPQVHELGVRGLGPKGTPYSTPS